MSGKTSRAEGGGRNSVLTSDHREFLTGINEKDGNTASKARESIRARIREAIFDLQLLCQSIRDQKAFAEKDILLTFEDGYEHGSGVLNDHPPRDSGIIIGTDYPMGYPREGDYATGFDGKSVIEAGIENLLEQSTAQRESPSPEADSAEIAEAIESKASPEIQEALVDSVALLCLAAEAGQSDPRDLLERGVEKYHNQFRNVDVLPKLELKTVQTLRREFREGRSLNPRQIRRLEARGVWEDIKKRARKTER